MMSQHRMHTIPAGRLRDHRSRRIQINNWLFDAERIVPNTRKYPLFKLELIEFTNNCYLSRDQLGCFDGVWQNMLRHRTID